MTTSVPRLTWMPLIPLDDPPATPPRPAPQQWSSLSGPDRFQPPRPLGRLPALYRPAVVNERRAVVAPGTPDKLAQAVARFDGLAWAGPLPANGNREASVLIPRGTDLNKPVELRVFFHGNGGTAASYTKWFSPYVQKLPAHGLNTVFVLPTAGPGNRSMDPQQGESLTALQDQAQAAAEQVAGRRIKVGSYTVDGFSGGGQPIAIAADAGQLRASHIDLYDSTYGNWHDRAVQGRQPGATVNAFYTEHNRLRAERLRGMPGVTVQASPTSHGATPVRYFYYYADGSELDV